MGIGSVYISTMEDLSSVHVSQIGFGGAWNAAIRISRAIGELGSPADLEFEVGGEKSEFLNGTRLMSKIDHEIQSRSNTDTTTSILRGTANLEWLQKIQKKHQNTNIWNLHWLPGYPNKSLFNLLKEKNVVWTLHDSNPYTGICHYAEPCKNFKTDCSHCPQILKIMNAVPRKVLDRKLQMIEQAKNLVFVAPSRWIMREFQESAVGQYADIVNIPNPIPEIFFFYKPEKRSNSFTITVLGSDYSKSKNSKLGALAIKRFIELNPYVEVKIQIIGEAYSFLKLNEQICLPPGSPQSKLAEFLKESDVFIYTSIFDNLPNLVLEAQAAGNIVMAIDAGGVGECFLDNQTGFSLESNPESICNALEVLIQNIEIIPSMSQRATQYIEDKFSNREIGKKYLDLYCDLTSRKQKI